MAEHLEFIISRTFNAPREAGWNAWTDSELLKLWFSPRGFTVVGNKLELTPGGTYHYGLRAPDGSTLWGKWTFLEIMRPEKLEAVISFSDEQGGVTRHPFVPGWPLETLAVTTFTESGGKTTLAVRWVAINATEQEHAVFDASGESMKQGWGGTLEQLEAYLAGRKTA